MSRCFLTVIQNPLEAGKRGNSGSWIVSPARTSLKDESCSLPLLEFSCGICSLPVWDRLSSCTFGWCSFSPFVWNVDPMFYSVNHSERQITNFKLLLPTDLTLHYSHSKEQKIQYLLSWCGLHWYTGVVLAILSHIKPTTVKKETGNHAIYLNCIETI